MEFVEYADREMMMVTLADRLSSELKSYLLHQDHASLAVPGGTTPGPIFDTLSGAALDWSRIHVMLTDERWVPEDHERSNTRLLRQRLLTGRAEEAQYVPLYEPTETPEDAMETLAARIGPELPLSLLLLGMGDDMHTASLFPGADRLDDALRSDAPPVMAMRGGGAPEPRVTLTGPVLRGAMSTHVLITGPSKREALERARHLKPSEAPVAAILGDATVHWAE
ncbi:6-phosphogluconolactonase [Tranquillimonas rosea]|uniref:6-phosphogluconolactonase n=1 Tax=Tranquillimonas rosea TaxID=641238 RepID=A0A1H9TH95_9RHOB|nr:6-phosphogluconolactonase [Tranquillimonas rosea]SER96498.1 6-phosphogluconolactonase [Tranquillimonas rosea]